MHQHTFNRYEKKYIITNAQKKHIIDLLKTELSFDPYNKNETPYHIYNLYYDTDDYGIIRDSLDKPVYKDKVRLRTYTYPITPKSHVFLEIKKKFDGRVNKRRIDMTYQTYLNLDQLEQLRDTYINKQIANEIDYLLKHKRLTPKAYVSYERLALRNADDSLRVTFDRHLGYRFNDLTLTKNDTFPIIDDNDFWLMEIKSMQNFPLWIVKLLSEHQIYLQSFSKYGKAYQKHIQGGHNANISIFSHGHD